MATFLCLITLVQLFLLFPFWFAVQASAQQPYYTDSSGVGECYSNTSENDGYICSSDQETSCNTYAYMRVASSHYTLKYISSMLNFSTSSEIASASRLSSSNSDVYVGEGLYIPFTCSCSGSISSYNITYTVAPDDTFWKLSHYIFENLTTCQAIVKGNPNADVNDLQVGQKVNIPIRCACPSKIQLSAGYKYLVTYPVNEGDDITSIVNRFGVNTDEFLTVNSISSSTELFVGTTVLLPFIRVPINPPSLTPQSESPSSSSSSSSSGNSKNVTYISVAIGVAVIFAIIVAVSCFLRKRKTAEVNTLPITTSPVKRAPKPVLQQDLYGAVSDIPSMKNKCCVFPLNEVKQATQDFSPSTLIKGSVYRGIIEGQDVVVKKASANVSKELEILQKVHHVNLVTLLGICIASPQHTYLVYEHAENGALSDWIHGENVKDSSITSSDSSPVLPWTTRLQIALDVASALEYIHEHISPSCVHKDINSSNILLDNKFRGKVANFGLAKSTTTNDDRTRNIVGTQGYIAPEYLNLGIVSPKMDVFAFGVVLLELLSGKSAILKDRAGKVIFLHDMIGPLLGTDDDLNGKERLREWMDPCLQDAYPLDYAYNVAVLARSCLNGDSTKRPKAKDVTYTLGKLLDMSIDWESSTATDQYQDNVLDAR